MLIFLLSLAGIPPTAGFLGKYYIFLSLIETGHYVLAVIGDALRRGGASTTTSASCAACSSAKRDAQEPALVAAASGLRFALALSGVMTLGIGLYPEPFLQLAQTSLLR